MMRQEYLENESLFYQITKRNDGKYISIDGYYYKTDSDFGNGPDRSVAFSGLEMPLAEFYILHKHRIKDGVIDELAADCKQYYDEVCFEREKSFYHNSIATELPLINVTMDTPCGCYVDFKEEN